MDRMTKLVAGRLKAQAPAGPHPEPELLAAFAENALSETERGPLLRHLGACSDCREILYLASPDSPAMQKGLVPQLRPFAFRRWIFGWGALAASVTIVAIFFTTNRLEHRNQSAKTVALAPTPASQAAALNSSTAASAPAAAKQSETKIATDKTPQELDRLQDERDRAQRDFSLSKEAVAQEKRESAPQPEAKHMTAKPQASLDFDKSGQVRVSAPKNPAPQSLDQTTATQSADSRIGDLSLRGRNVNVPAVSIPPNASPAVPPSPVGGMVAGQNAVGGAYSRADQLAKKANLEGNLGGTIVDPSGAVVANARVTLIGPTGQKSVVSDSAGRFSFATVDPGSYSLKAEANGFKATEIQQVAVLNNKPAVLNVRLEVGTASDVVEVSGTAPVIAETRPPAMDAAGASSGYVAQSQTAQNLAVLGANFDKSRLKDAKAASGAGGPALKWTLSPEGLVQRSGDDGKNWQPVAVAGSVTFRALSAVGSDIWVGGKAGAFYHSANSGESWVKIEPAAGSKKLDQDIARVDFSDSQNGTVNTVNGEVWSTPDGGKTWLLK